jgi:hypothetical protein
MSILDVDVDELPDSDTIPAGEYLLRIDSVSDPQTDKNEQQFVKIEFTVAEGEYANRKVYENYVPLQGKSTLKKIIRAAGYDKPRLTSTDDLVGLELKATVKIEKSDKYGDQNRIAHYLVPQEATQAPTAAAGTNSGKKKK